MALFKANFISNRATPLPSRTHGGGCSLAEVYTPLPMPHTHNLLARHALQAHTRAQCVGMHVLAALGTETG